MSRWASSPAGWRRGSPGRFEVSEWRTAAGRAPRGGESLDIALGEEEAGVVVVERGEESGGGALVVRHRVRDDAAVREPFAHLGQVAVGLQLAQGGGDTGLAVGEAVGEGLDVDEGLVGQRLDVQGEADRGERELSVLGEVVADDREPGRVWSRRAYASEQVGNAAELRTATRTGDQGFCGGAVG